MPLSRRSTLFLLFPLAVLLLFNACDTRTYPGDEEDDEGGSAWAADSVAITSSPVSVVGLDSVVVTLHAFAFRNGEPLSDLRVYFGYRQLDDAFGYFLQSEVESSTVPPGRAVGNFVSNISPSGRVRLFVEPAPGYGGDSVDVVLHKRPILTMPADTSIPDTTISIMLPLTLTDDRQMPLVDELVNFDAWPQHGVVTATVYTNHIGYAEIYFDPQGYSGLFSVIGWLPAFPTSVRDTVLINVWDTTP